MRNILSNIRFTPSFLTVALGFVLTGYIKNLLIFTSFILIHEMGHYFIGRGFGYKVQKIYIYPFGGLTKFQHLINQNSNEEFLVSISGVLFQSLLYYFYLFLYQQNLLHMNTFLLVKKYHCSMLFFNLLPIIPLDGSQIIGFFLYKIFSYKMACYVKIIISFLSIILFWIWIFPITDYNYLLIILILCIDIIRYMKDLKYYFHKFLLERYLYHFSFKRCKKVKNVSQMYKDYRHLIYDDQKYITEKHFLQKMFDL